MLNAELTAPALAALVEVDVKTVTRWIGEDRVPYPITRTRVARALHQEETFLWPALLEGSDACAVTGAEVERTWPTRSAIASETWHALFSKATSKLDILVYAGAFLIETLDFADVVRWKAAEGTAIRILIGDPDSLAVRMRATELSLDWLPERCRSTMRYLEQVNSVPRVSILPHGAIHYVSLFRFDDTLLANTHAFGTWACHSPVHQMHRVCSGRLFDFYTQSFERAWRAALYAYPAPSHLTDSPRI